MLQTKLQKEMNDGDSHYSSVTWKEKAVSVTTGSMSQYLAVDKVVSTWAVLGAGTPTECARKVCNNSS